MIEVRVHDDDGFAFRFLESGAYRICKSLIFGPENRNDIGYVQLPEDGVSIVRTVVIHDQNLKVIGF